MKKMQILARALQPKNKSLARLITSAADNNFQVNLVRKLVANKIPFEIRNGTVDVVTASDLSPEGKKLLMENYGFKPEDFSARKPLEKDPFKNTKESTTDVKLNEPDPFRNTNNKNVGGESHKRGNPFTQPKAGAVSASVKCPHCGKGLK